MTELLLIVELELRVEHLVDGHDALDRTGDVVDILGLDQRLEVVFEDFSEVVL